MKGLIFNNLMSSVADNSDYIRARIERLLFIPEGEILGFPDYGSAIQDFFHEIEDDISADDIINEITFLMQEREPELEIDDIYIEILNADAGQNGILIRMNIYDNTSQQNQEIEFFKIVEV
jgi:phage baseplate assembly protein W